MYKACDTGYFDEDWYCVIKQERLDDANINL